MNARYADRCARLREGGTVLLRAVDPARNVYREYAIEVSRDLFGLILVSVRWGRVHAAGRRQSWACERIEDVDRRLRDIFRRRSSATKRIGTGYLIVD